MNKDRANRNILQFKNGFKVFHVKNEGICIAPTNRNIVHSDVMQFKYYDTDSKILKIWNCLHKVILKMKVFAEHLQRAQIEILYTLMQSCKMSKLLHGAKPSTQILPEENLVNRDNFYTLVEPN